MRTRKLPDGRTKVLIQGVSRAAILGLKQTDPYPVVSMKLLLDKEIAQEGDALCRSVKEQLEKNCSLWTYDFSRSSHAH